ncbi:hypothetical protein PIB30_003403 [Stylosanthes scabra]|uniref:Pectinesterase inhibitor domain-containing protein n=1 Tax=Stylosanthes scabra TaxID=79078 RepID=A0ABU6U438_9FABA|nr:hypothetical protein [Stylosanthes scabra]
MVLAKGNNNNNGYVREACSVTRYQDLCVHSLAQFSNTAGTSPSKWARAGVSVTIGEVKKLRAYLAQLKRNGGFMGRNRAALSDCAEVFDDALDELHRSLGVLRKLSKTTFSTQMEDLNTWISAALTDEDTCLDGFQEQDNHNHNNNSKKQIKLLQSRVQNVSYITSNALALVNKLATTGIGSNLDQHKS